jgi:hypothetical protein
MHLLGQKEYEKGSFWEVFGAKKCRKVHEKTAFSVLACRFLHREYSSKQQSPSDEDTREVKSFFRCPIRRAEVTNAAN